MSRPIFPPTPASSTDIQGKDGSKHLADLHLPFELPPPALVRASGGGDGKDMSPDTNMPSPPLEPDVRSPSASKKRTSPSSSSPKSAYPVQASETVKSRRRTSAVQAQAQVQAQLQAQSPSQTQSHSIAHEHTVAGNDTFVLPPPPTRSRKIIQMKPRTAVSSGPAKNAAKGAKQDQNGSTAVTAAALPPSAPVRATKGSAATFLETSLEDPAALESSAPATTGSKKKQPSATSAAGRKMARKTAHSLIERRRRSKMNEEFAVLKSMIPACTGEMHKLAILQASIEYVRYLEDCVTALKSQRETDGQQWQQTRQTPAPVRIEQHPYSHAPISSEESSLDVEMTGIGNSDRAELVAKCPAWDENDRNDQDEVEDDDLGENDAHGAYTESGSDHGHPQSQHGASASPALPAKEHQHTPYHQQDGPRRDTLTNAPSPATSSRYSPSLVAAVSESLAATATAATEYRHRQNSSFSYSAGGFTTSAQTSPAFGPQQNPFPLLPLSAAASPYLYGNGGSGIGFGSAGEQGTFSARASISISGSTLTSPVLLPQLDMDQEATAALLMLNSDRRGTSASVSGDSGSNGDPGGGNSSAPRGMSVRDLLSA